MTATVATEPASWSFAAPWGARGFVSDLGGGAPVHWIEFGDGTGDKAPPLVLVHGLGGSHLNWVQIGPALAEHRRVVALDLHGFGLSPGTRADSTVSANAELLHRFVRDIVGEPVVLVGNSMGGMISILETHAHPDEVLGLVLVDPALPSAKTFQRPDRQVLLTFVIYAVPRLGEMYLRRMGARLTSEQLTRRLVELCFADPSRADPQVLAAGAALGEERRTVPGQEAAFLGAARSLLRTIARPAGYRAKMQGISVPTVLINGEADRLVPIASARRAAADNPRWRALFLPGVGHTPQLETPATVIEAVTGLLAELPSQP
jgi:pimeloyl-ACP methyl ester carboxylesterase